MVGSATEKMENEQKRQTKVAVQDDLRTAITPEKKLQTAEIEIYRLVMSNGVFGDGNEVNENLGFRFWDQKFSGVQLLELEILMF